MTASTPPLDFSRLEQIGNGLLGQLDALREVAPIYWSENERSWIITGHAEVRKGLSGALPLSAARHKLFELLVPDAEERQQIIPNLVKYFPGFLINLDPPQHTRVRKLMMSAFSRKVAEAYRPQAREAIRKTLDGLAGRDTVEFVEEVGRQITARNIMRIMGLEDEEFYLPKLKHWAYLSGAGLTGRPSRERLMEVDASFAEISALMQVEVDKKRANPTGDFVSMLVHAEDGGDRFTDEELVGNLRLILMAGHDTTLNTMALSIHALSRDPAAADFMRAHPEANLNSIQELMRFIAMSTEQTRIVAEDFEWDGHALEKGQLVRLMIAGGNRDPLAFAEPERLDLTRPQEDNLTFGPGPHHCIGHFFAKMQLTEFFPEFLRRYDRFEVLDPELKFGAGLTFRGPQTMTLRLHAAGCLP